MGKRYPERDVLKLGAVEALDGAASVATSLTPGDWIDTLDRCVEAGNGVPLWGALAASLAATGRLGRRAALAGLVAAAAGSAISNGIVKPAVHRPRPVQFAARRHRRTASFPSSHATTGAAFSTAAGVAWSPSALLTVPVVTAVAFSRVHGRQHRIGDVAAGLGLGALVGAAVGAAARRAPGHERPV